MVAALNVPIPTIAEATQNAARLLQQSLAMAQQAAGVSSAGLSAMDIELARSNIKALAFVQGLGVHGAYRYLRDFIARQAVPIWSAGEFLDGWLASYGMSRKQAQAASGPLTGTGIAGTTLAAGTLLQSASGATYTVIADAVVAVGGALAASVVATVPGVLGNQAQGATLTLTSPVAGINASFLVAAGTLSGGTDVEQDTEAAYRLQQRLSYEPMGGAPGDYARWALEVPGITRAWGLRNPAGPTSAGVVIIADANAPYGLPTAGQRQQVIDYITDPDRGPPDELFVIIPTATPIHINVVLNPNTAAVRSGVTAALKDLFFRESAPGGKIPHSHLIEVISGVTGEYDHSFVSPAISVGGVFQASGYSELLVLGNITFS
jgi:uncharacterized phage protein gp47/JayE